MHHFHVLASNIQTLSTAFKGKTIQCVEFQDLGKFGGIIERKLIEPDQEIQALREMTRQFKSRHKREAGPPHYEFPKLAEPILVKLLGTATRGLLSGEITLIELNSILRQGNMILELHERLQDELPLENYNTIQMMIEKELSDESASGSESG